MLKDNGFVVGESYDFEATLDMLKTVNFDILICCSAPREISCDELAIQAKQLQPNIKVIVATTQNEHPHLDHTKEVDLVLLKPFDLRVLIGFMNDLLKVKVADFSSVAK
jgi:DNA-binding response OmpR family regulator